jgi:hypothetical protein
MNAHPKFLNLAALALVAIAGSVAVAACSSDDNAAPGMDVLDSGSDSTASSSGSGSSSGSSGSSSGDAGGDAADAGPACTPDGGAGATCNSCAVIGGNDTYNTCSSFNCQGPYNNATHGVPSPLPPL